MVSLPAELSASLLSGPGLERVASASAAVGQVSCSHCGAPVPPALQIAEATEQFCCGGCRQVFALLRECGLERYYEFRGAAEVEPEPAQPTDREYAEFDDAAFAELYCRPGADGTQVVELYLEGVHCSACVWLVEKLPSLLPGVRQTTLDFLRRVVRVSWDPEAIALSRIARQLDRFGYPVHPYRGSGDVERQRHEERALLMRVGVAGAAAGNVMLMALALYSGLFDGMDPEFQRFFRWGSLLISAPAVLWSGSVFFRGALAAVRTRTPHMDLPVSIGILAGFIWGGIGTLLGKGEIYFDSVTMLVFVLLVGRWIQHRQQRSAFEAAELLSTLTPSTARLVEGSTYREVPAGSVSEGALVEVRVGETIPVDGQVEEGVSALDTALLTGESLPIDVAPGTYVHAGATNLSSPLSVRCARAGANTRVGQLMRSVEEAARRRAPMVRLADRIAGRLVVVALVLAVGTLVGWSFVSVERAIDHSVALLVVACPCGLGLATPLVVSAALARAARRGLLIKGGDVVEKLAAPGTFVFDKTGTLTAGQMRLVEYVGDPALQPAILALEARSVHPIARAFVAALSPEAGSGSGAAEALSGPTEGDEPLAVQDVREILGGGVEGRVAGEMLLIGSEALVRARNVDVPTWVEEQVARSLERGLSPVLVARQGRVEALGAFGDPLRPDAAASLQALKELGHRLILLSGDHRDAASHAARELEWAAGQPLFDEVLGGQTPEQKLAYVESLAERQPVYMVGDGVNDAAALSAASVGIAVHGGAEASLLAADVFARRPGVEPVLELSRGARRTLRVLRRGLGVSLLYNVVGLSAAVAGWISPLMAAVLMPLSSLTVVGNAYRSRTFGVDHRSRTPGVNR